MYYLEDIKLKNERKQYLESNFVGKKAFMLVEKAEYNSSTNYSKCHNSIKIKQVKITAVTDRLNVVVVDKNMKKAFVRGYAVEKLLILDLEEVKDKLVSLFVKKEEITVASPLTFGKEICPRTVTLDILFNSRLDVYSNMPDSKYKVSTTRPIILHLDIVKNKILFKEVGSAVNGLLLNSDEIVSVEAFSNGFYYGLDEMSNLVDDVITYSQINFIKKYFLQKIS